MCLFYSNGNHAFWTYTCVCVCVCVCICIGGEGGECFTTYTLIKVTLTLTFGKQKVTVKGKRWSG